MSLRGTIERVVRCARHGVQGWDSLRSRAEAFRKCADECYRLSGRLKSPEHKAFAVYLAGAWLALAEQAERTQAVRDGMISTATFNTDDQAGDPGRPDEPIE
jgi:hypothetical protein